MSRLDGEGLTWDEASPALRKIVAQNQQWAENNGYAPKGSPEHGALRMSKGDIGSGDSKKKR